jgi:hypothetical protein
MPLAEDTEAAFILKDQRDLSCRVAFLGAGQETFVPISPEQSDQELSDPDMERALDAHSHPLTNADYFSDSGRRYNGEIMFATETDIAAHRLTGELYKQSIAWVRSGRVAGFNMSPPSIQDFMAAGANVRYNQGTAGRVKSLVLTSGGAWTYFVKDAQQVNKTLDDLVVYANIFEAANSPVPSAKRERARKLYAALESDPVSSSLMAQWAGPSLALRTPYSADALLKQRQNDDSGIRREFAAKLVEAERFCAFMRSIGVEISFSPYGRGY